METIYFLIFVGVCAFGVVWATRASKTKTNLARKSRAHRSQSSSDKLATPMDTTLSHREAIWEQRRNRAARGFVETQSFVPKSEAGSAPAYDGYSRRHRHHVSPTGAAKEDVHLEDEGDFAVTRTRFENKNQAAQS